MTDDRPPSALRAVLRVVVLGTLGGVLLFAVYLGIAILRA